MHSYGYTVHSTHAVSLSVICVLCFWYPEQQRHWDTVFCPSILLLVVANNKMNSKFVQICQPAIEKGLRYYCAWKPYLKVEITLTVSLTGHIEVSWLSNVTLKYEFVSLKFLETILTMLTHLSINTGQYTFA